MVLPLLVVISAKQLYKKLLPKYAKNYHIVPPVPVLKNYFSNNFDMIFANQVLYYLNDFDLSNLISQFYNMLKPDGIFFATMMPPTCYYNNFVVSNEGGLDKIKLKGRLNEISFINFKTKKDCLELFKQFLKIHLGSYSLTIREDEGSIDHIIFVGKK
jgi:hypothetical protein